MCQATRASGDSHTGRRVSRDASATPRPAAVEAPGRRCDGAHARRKPMEPAGRPRLSVVPGKLVGVDRTSPRARRLCQPTRPSSSPMWARCAGARFSSTTPTLTGRNIVATTARAIGRASIPPQARSHAPLISTHQPTDLYALEPPCTRLDPELFFANTPEGVEHAKSLCARCPIRRSCLAGALARAEFYGVWGGELVVRGEIVPRKRGRGRPPKRRATVEPGRAACA